MDQAPMTTIVPLFAFGWISKFLSFFLFISRKWGHLFSSGEICLLSIHLWAYLVSCLGADTLSVRFVSLQIQIKFFILREAPY